MVSNFFTDHDFLGPKRWVWIQVLVSFEQFQVSSVQLFSFVFSSSSFDAPVLSKVARFPGVKDEIILILANLSSHRKTTEVSTLSTNAAKFLYFQRRGSILKTLGWLVALW